MERGQVGDVECDMVEAPCLKRRLGWVGALPRLLRSAILRQGRHSGSQSHQSRRELPPSEPPLLKFGHQFHRQISLHCLSPIELKFDLRVDHATATSDRTVRD